MNGCYTVRTASGQTLGPFRMQATALGQYLLYGGPAKYLGAGLKPDSTPSNSTVWIVEHHFTITNLLTGEQVPVSFQPASGCAAYPEAGVSAAGQTFKGASPESQVSGTIDAHTHVTAFEFLGGDWHCGRPWHPFGIPFALPDCAPYETGSNGQVESFIDYGTPSHPHDTRGWPTFHAWPSPTDLAETGQFWDVQTCSGPEHDNTQLNSLPTGALSQLMNGPGRTLLLSSAGLLPLYPPPPHCNAQGLTSLGAYLINKMIQQRFIVELDHMDVKTAESTLSILEAHHYSGVISAHSWDSPQENPRIYKLGGFTTPIAGVSPQSFISQWQTSRGMRDKRFYSGTGFGYGADMNGLAEESQPTSGHPIGYPFRSYDGRVTFSREQWGQRSFDLNRDGVANYGMFPDWLQELQTLAGRPILTDMFRGAEAYLQMWERAYGVPATSCRPRTGSVGPHGVGALALGAPTQAVLYAAGQPVARPSRSYQFCATGGGVLDTVFRSAGHVALVAATANGYRGGGHRVGDRVRGRSGLRLGRVQRGGSRYRFGVRGGRVSFVGVASRGSRRQIVSDVHAAGLR